MNHGKPIAEILEKRVLLAFASLNVRGTLSVVGTGKDNDIIVEKSGSNILAKRDGETLSFSANQVKRIWIDAFGGNDAITNKTALPSTLRGGSGNDTIVGGGSNDTIEGLGGDDHMNGGGAVNQLAGGSGDNALNYQKENGIKLDIRSNDPFNDPLPGFTIEKNDKAAIDHLEPQSSLRIIGSPGNDKIHTILEVDASIEAAGGNDIIDGGRGWLSTAHVTVYGDAGDDTIYHNEDFGFTGGIYGGSGDDTLISHTKMGFTDAGPGFDTEDLTYQSAPNGGPFHMGKNVERFLGMGDEDVTIYGNELDNIIYATQIDQTIFGGAGNDTIISVYPDSMQSEVRIFLYGEAGNDHLIGSVEAADYLDGGDGFDTLEGHGNNDILIGGASKDFILGHAGDDSIDGGGGNDVINGGSGNDTLIGGAGNDLLFGQGGDDTIFADDGHFDLVDGGSGNDSARSDEDDERVSIEVLL